MYIPSFTCKHCGLSKEASDLRGSPIFVPCDCKEAREEREYEHRVAMERRKQRKRV